MKKAFENLKHNCLHLNFPNGNSISTIWGPGSYSENHDAFDDPNEFIAKYKTFMDSNDVEVMISCPDKLYKRIARKYNEGSDNSVIGYLNITQWLEILKLISKDPKKLTKED